MNPAVTGDCQAGVSCTAKQLQIPQGNERHHDRLLRPAARQHSSGAASARWRCRSRCSISKGRWRVNLQDLCTRLSLARDGILFTDPEQHYDAATGDLSLKDGTRIRLGLGQVAPAAPRPASASARPGSTSRHRTRRCAFPTGYSWTSCHCNPGSALAGGPGHGGSPAGRGHLWPG